MFLHKPKGTGSVCRSELAHRFDLFPRGSWSELIHKVCAERPVRPVQNNLSEKQEQERRGKAAQNRVQQGQVSRPWQELTGATLAPRNEATLEELR